MILVFTVMSLSLAVTSSSTSCCGVKVTLSINWLFMEIVVLLRHSEREGKQNTVKNTGIGRRPAGNFELLKRILKGDQCGYRQSAHAYHNANRVAQD